MNEQSDHVMVTDASETSTSLAWQCLNFPHGCQDLAAIVALCGQARKRDKEMQLVISSQCDLKWGRSRPETNAVRRHSHGVGC